MTPDGQPEVSRGPLCGSMVVYRHGPDDGQEAFRIGVVIGPVVAEPMTGDLWVGVRLSRDAAGGPAVDFIDVASIVDTSPPDDDT